MPDHDTILFAIGDGLQTINVGFLGTGMPLPAITAPVTIDAQNSPFFPLQIVELMGLGLPPGADGLVLAAGSSGSTIRGLIINRFTGNGIRVNFMSNDNFIEGNRIGTDWTGTQHMGNWQNGIYIDSDRNTVGGTTTDKRNLISANLQNGIHINTASNNNKIYGNYIGTDWTGTQDLGNASGVFVHSSSGTRIGHFLATLPGAGNVISGNDAWGVILTSLDTPVKPTDNVIAQNYIGTDQNGTARLGNTLDGVYIIDAFMNFVEENVISANLGNGIAIFESTDPTVTDNNKVRNNKIGVDKNGDFGMGMGMGNLDDGIRIENASYNKIGYGGQGNVISGNGDYGIRIWTTPMGESKFNVVESNYIGTNGAGNQAVKNADGGILLRQADRNTIGGAAAARNIISGNGTPLGAEPGHGIWLQGSKFNTVTNNYIGYGAGQQALGNEGNGVALQLFRNRSSSDNTGDGNWIDHNKKPQIRDLTTDPAFDGGKGNTIKGGPGGKIGANGGLGIDMGPEGVTLNDDNETDGVQNFPVIPLGDGFARNRHHLRGIEEQAGHRVHLGVLRQRGLSRDRAGSVWAGGVLSWQWNRNDRL